MPMPKAPSSGDYVSTNDGDSDGDGENDSGNDTEYDDHLIDYRADVETGLEYQSDGILQPLRDNSSDRRQRRRSLMEEDGDALTLDVPPAEEQGEKDKPITWMSLVGLF